MSSINIWSKIKSETIKSKNTILYCFNSFSLFHLFTSLSKIRIVRHHFRPDHISDVLYSAVNFRRNKVKLRNLIGQPWGSTFEVNGGHLIRCSDSTAKDRLDQHVEAENVDLERQSAGTEFKIILTVIFGGKVYFQISKNHEIGGRYHDMILRYLRYRRLCRPPPHHPRGRGTPNSKFKCNGKWRETRSVSPEIGTRKSERDERSGSRWRQDHPSPHGEQLHLWWQDWLRKGKIHQEKEEKVRFYFYFSTIFHVSEGVVSKFILSHFCCGFAAASVQAALPQERHLCGCRKTKTEKQVYMYASLLRLRRKNNNSKEMEL